MPKRRVLLELSLKEDLSGRNRQLAKGRGLPDLNLPKDTKRYSATEVANQERLNLGSDFDQADIQYPNQPQHRGKGRLPETTFKQ